MQRRGIGSEVRGLLPCRLERGPAPRRPATCTPAVNSSPTARRHPTNAEHRFRHTHRINAVSRFDASPAHGNPDHPNSAHAANRSRTRPKRSTARKARTRVPQRPAVPVPWNPHPTVPLGKECVQVPPRPLEDPSSAGVFSRLDTLTSTGLLPGPRDPVRPTVDRRGRAFLVAG